MDVVRLNQRGAALELDEGNARVPIAARQGVAAASDPGEGPEVGVTQGFVGVVGGWPRSGRCRRVQWRQSVAARAAGDADTGGFDALGMASGGGGAEGHTSNVRTGIGTRMVVAED